MNSIFWTAAMFFLGAALALVWLAALWINVHSLVRNTSSWQRLATGALLRLLIVGAGFYLVISLSRHWTQLLAALAGFVAARLIVLMMVRRREDAESSSRFV